MKDTSKFWDKIAPKYAANPIKDMDAYEQTMERVRAHLTKDDNVLEIGCGTGATALLLAPHARHITASDYSAGMIAQAEARLTGGENVSFVTADPLELSEREGSFDVVMAFNLLHLIDDTEGVLRSVHNLLRPGGLFISKTPSLAGHYRFLRMLLPLAQLFGKAPSVTVFSERELEAAITWQGFDIIETANFPPNKPNRFIVARRR